MADPRSPKSPRKGKMVSLRVSFLNDTVHAFQMPVKAVGITLWEAVVTHLQMLEADYFGLEYTNHNGDECWLDNDKQILKQLPSPDAPLRFGVKFYTPDPGLLEDELTRFCFALQIRRDLFAGELHCSENTAALLASYIVQGDIGDFLVDEYTNISYLSSFEFLPKGQQTVEFLQKVMDYHRQHVGESPSETDANLLDTARKVEMYGIKFHPGKDHEGVALNLAVAHMGVLVFQGMTKINTFSWAKIRKLSFKRKKFLIKLHPESYAMRKNEAQENKEALSLGYYKDTVEFFFDSRDRCKYFWKKCIEHHTFFRCQTVKKLPRNKARVVSRGSSFRYSGRTQKELQEFVRESIVKRPQFERSVSGRISSRSTSVTPKISTKPSMHNSADLHNSTASSGSHILEANAGLPPLPPTRLETAEVHSDSSMSGSRSLGSPRLEHGLSADSEGGDFVNQPVDMAAVDARLPHSDSQGADSDFDKFDDIPLSVSERVTQPDVAFSNFPPRSHLHQDDENVTDADVDDVELDNDDKDEANLVLSANQNALDIGGRETGAIADHAVEYVNGQSLAAISAQTAVTTQVNGRPSAEEVAVADTAVSQQEAERGAGKVDVTRGSVPIDSHSIPVSPRSVGELAAAAVAVAKSKDPPPTDYPPEDQPSQDQPSQDRPSQDQPSQQQAPPPTHDQPAPASLHQQVSVTQAQVHAVQSEESGSRGSPAAAETRSVTSSATSTPSIAPVAAETRSVTSSATSSPSLAHVPSPLIRDTDLNEEIPYVLHRRQYKDHEEKQEETSVFKTGGTPSPVSTLLRQSRSHSPRGKLSHEDADGIGRKIRPDRSPSAGRRFELIHYNKLPAKDSFSSVDDTTSPSFEKDLLKSYSDSPQSEAKSLDSAEGVRREESGEPQHAPGPAVEATPSPAEVIRPPEGEIMKGAAVDSKQTGDKAAEPDAVKPSSQDGVKPKPPPVVPKPEKPVLKLTIKQKEAEILVQNGTGKGVPKEPGPETVKIDAKASEGTVCRVVENAAEITVEKTLDIVDHKAGGSVNHEKDKVLKEVGALTPPSPPLPPPPLSPPLPPPPPMKRPQNPTMEMGPVPSPQQPILTTLSTNTVTVAKPLVAAKPKPPPVMPKTSKKPPVAPKTKSAPSKPPRETGVPAPASTVLPLSEAPATEEHEFPPPPSDMTSSITGDLDLDSLPPPPSELLMDLSSQSSGTSPESPASFPPLPPEAAAPPSQDSAPKSRPVSVSLTQSNQGNLQPDKERPPGEHKSQEQSKDQPASSAEASTTEAQRIMDLPSPAAALIFSESDSPTSQVEAPSPALTFTTFRPDPSEADSVITVTATNTLSSLPTVSVSDVGSNSSSGYSSQVLSGYVCSARDPRKRWSLERVEEEPSKEALEERERARMEPKRVSWHEETVHSFHSDVSMTVMRSPVDESSSSLGGSPHRDDIDSGDLMDTLENLRQGSESDLTYSGSSGSSSNPSDTEDCSTAKEVYLQYAATKCLAESGKDTTFDSGMGEMSSEGTVTTTASQQRGSTSPLDTLERLGSLEGSFVSDTKRPSIEEFPPPPAFLYSRGSTGSSTSLEMAAAAAVASVSMAHRRLSSVDPMLNMDGGDPMEEKISTNHVRHHVPSPVLHIHSHGGLEAKDRKFSAPVFKTTEDHPSLEDKRLSRTAEVENIPEIVEEDRVDHNGLGSPNRRSLIRSASEANQDVYIYRNDFDELPPPPPPPPCYEEEEEDREGEEDADTTREDLDEEGEGEARGKFYLHPSGNPAADISSSSIGFPSNISSISTGLEGEEDTRRKSKRRPTDTAYYIVKELLMTERAYKKDLEVLCVWFRNAVGGDPEMVNSLTELIFSRLDPIYEFHAALLKEIDQRITLWEGKSSSTSQMNGDCHHIGDLMLRALEGAKQLYQNYFSAQEDMVSELDQRVKHNKTFEEAYREFESQKVCYLPLNTFFLKPGQRLLHYRLVLERLVKHYPPSHPDAADCQAAFTKVRDLTEKYRDKLHQLSNLQKLMELQRDLIGLDHLVNLDREFLREGCLQKYSRKGYQQRMFFLFSDMLVYTSRAASSLLQFKVHGQLPLKGMTIEETEQSKVAVPNTFAIYGGGRCILVAASSQEEKNKWIEDINQAVQVAAQRPDIDKPQYPSLKSSSSSTENVDAAGAGDNDRVAEKPVQHRSNTTMHVCWHRNTSVSSYDHERALKNQLSGYLLRKFKTSNGWQKLWVVFTNFCLFFYKTYQDDFPLASLPLLGYAINQPEAEDGISKDHVFKLQFKNHVYFFRAESEYTYSRWMEVINSATSSARRTRLFSRMVSQMDS